MLAEEHSVQCGALFGFGLKANKSTGTLLNLSAASAAVKEKLKQPPIFIFSPNDSPSKTMKNVFYFIKETLFVLKIFKFL